MDEKQTTFGLGPEEVANLFMRCSDVGQSKEPVDEDEVKAMLLNDWLSESIPQRQPPCQELPARQPDLTHTMGALTGQPLRTLIEDKSTGTGLLTGIKVHAKELYASAESESQRHVANTIYYAAIASALVLHNRKITSYSYADMAKSFGILSRETWIPNGLRRLFRQACERCQAHE